VRTEHDPVRWAGVIVVDITERLRAEEALRQTEKLAATGRLAASIAHEINNPLEAVTNLLYLLHTYQPMDPTALGFIATAQGELERVSEITQQMLRFHRQSTLPRVTNIAEMLGSVLRLYQSRMVSAHVALEKRYDESSEVFGFSGEIRQVLANLIGNALDAMPNGGRLFLRVRNGSGRRSDGEWSTGVRVSVTDTGTGMSEETLRRVFEAFFTTKPNTGTGLGLWISEEIITKHAGTVRIKSRTGSPGWTSFALFFPVNGLSHAQAKVSPSEVA
jgi:signal transduction histidine kinase